MKNVKEEVQMSFADELRKTNIKTYEAENRRVETCMLAIRDTCLKNKKLKKNYIKGWFYADDSDYGSYEILDGSLDEPRGTVFTYKDYDWDYMRKLIVQGIKDLGFTHYKVMVQTRKETTREKTFFGKFKEIPTGKIGRSVYIEIKW